MAGIVMARLHLNISNPLSTDLIETLGPNNPKANLR
jgi:hypothetical protein